jgi:hypothetical protein
MRDVIIVTSSATQSHGRTPAGLIRAFPNR